MTSQAHFVSTHVAVALGTTTTERLVVVNDGDEEETYRLTPAGLAAGWVTLRPTTLTVPAHAEETVEVEIHPPRLPTTSAGPTGLTVRIATQRPDTEVLEAPITLDVQPVRDRRLSLLQPAQRGKRGATYELTLENRGNVQASCRMRLVDPTGRLEADFEPPAVGVDPGGTALVRAKVHTSQRQWERRRRTLTFRVEAEQAGVSTVGTTGTLVQTPMLPERLGSWVAGLVAVLAVLAGAWFVVVKPAIDDAAADAVDERLASSVPTTVVDPPATTTAAPTTAFATVATTAAPTTVAATPPTTTTVTTSGALFSTLLQANVAPGQFGEAAYTVPDGTVLRITDVIVQNPNGDRGVASLSVGDDPKLSWTLEFVAPTLATPLVSPIEAAGGTVVHFVVTCTSVGSTTATTGTCRPAVLLSGLTAPSA